MKRNITILVLLIIGIICVLIGWNFETTQGTNPKSLILLLGGAGLTIGMLGVVFRDITDWIRNKLQRK